MPSKSVQIFGTLTVLQVRNKIDVVAQNKKQNKIWWYRQMLKTKVA